MTDTVRAIRAAAARSHRRTAGLIPARRYAPRPWYRVQPRGYYVGPTRPHRSAIGWPAGGKTPAGASVYSLSPDGRSLRLVR